jgi:trehalose-6-phosphatase
MIDNTYNAFYCLTSPVIKELEKVFGPKGIKTIAINGWFLNINWDDKVKQKCVDSWSSKIYCEHCHTKHAICVWEESINEET